MKYGFAYSLRLRTADKSPGGIRSGRLWALWRIARPVTLPAPALGIISGALAGSAAVGQAIDDRLVWNVIAGSTSYVLLNAGSNALNQYCDIESDAIDKPARPLPARELTPAAALGFALACYTLAALFAWTVVIPVVGREFGVLFGAAVAATLGYSVPPVRTKRYAWAGLGTIAVARGLILFVSGWATVASVRLDPEPWFLGAVIALFLVGAAGTKDFADIRGDSLSGCRSLPVCHGIQGAARRIAPFFVVPWLLLVLGAWGGSPQHWLRGDPIALSVVAAGLILYGAWVARLMLRPVVLGQGEPHPAWWHMYAMLGIAQAGIALAYRVASEVS